MKTIFDRADYDLRYAAIGLLSSFWSKQVDATTKDQVRNLATVAAGTSQAASMARLTDVHLDINRTLVEDQTFDFIDGDFAHVGPDLRSALRSQGEDGTMSVVVRRLPWYPSTAEELPTINRLFTKSALFQVAAGGHMEIPTTDAYLVPIPENVTPVIINSVIPDVYLVAGIDFEVHRGFIMLRENPAEVLATPHVTMLLAYVENYSPHNYFWGLPRTSVSDAFMAQFKKQASSLPLLKSALAEYAGFWVAPVQDHVMDVIQTDTEVVYVMHRGGVVRIDYPHWILSEGQTIQAGQAISGRLGVKLASEAPWLTWPTATAGISMDTVLPVAGLALPTNGMITATKSVGAGGFDKVRYSYLEIVPGALAKLWALQDARDEVFGVPIEPVTTFVDPDTTKVVNMWEILAQHYGDRLMFVEIGETASDMRQRITKFIREHAPVGTLVLACDLPEDILQ
jgi:hypothetical protein